MKTLIITGGSFDKAFAASFYGKDKYDYVIAVDGGLEYCRESGIEPDMIVGDFDTYGTDGLEEYIKRGVKVRRFIPEKDDTDTEIAIHEAVERGSDIDILGAFGGRLDHTLANIHNLYFALESGIRARLVSADNIVFLENKPFELTREYFPLEYVSFVPFAGAVTGIKLKGFKYPLDGYTLKPGYSRCISNEFTDDTAYVSMESGILIAVNSADSKL